MEERLTHVGPAGGGASAPPLVALRGVDKRFGGVHALKGVSVEVHPGKVHALVGENGAGKSTLGKIIGGVIQRDGGDVFVGGEGVDFVDPRQALQAGIAVIAQELALVPDATVAENVFLGIEDHRGSVLRPSAMRARFGELVEMSGFTTLRADTVVRSLNVAEQQKVEVLRAIAREARLIVMDEPTARLSAAEALHLRTTISDMCARGTAVVYVSHFLDEVLAISDTVTVLRDGRLVDTVPAADVDVERLAEMMVGRNVVLHRRDLHAASHRSSETPRLVVDGLTRHGAFHDVTFAARPGEVLAITGLVGSGRSEVLHAIFGSDRVDAGTVQLDGKLLSRRSPRRSIARGIALLPESRKDQGLVMGATVVENIVSASLAQTSARGVLRKRAERARAAQVAERVGVEARHLDRPVSLLSGGNQQKVLFAKWLVTKPTVLCVDEPTRGVDIGAKEAIYELLRDVARSGAAVIVVSSEIDEVLAIADRVLVMRFGRVVAEMTGDQIAEAPIARASLGAGTVKEAAA